MESEKFHQINQIDKAVVLGSAALASPLVTFTAIPAFAQTNNNSAVSDINAMVSSLGTIAAGVTTVILGAMVVRLGIKFVNRMTVKG